MASSQIVATVTQEELSKKGKQNVHSSLNQLPVLCMSWHVARLRPGFVFEVREKRCV